MSGPRLRMGPLARWRGVTTPDANGVLEVSFNRETDVLRVLLNVDEAEQLNGALGSILRDHSDRESRQSRPFPGVR